MSDPNGIVSWITENNYSKSTELLYFISCLTIPAILSFIFSKFYSKNLEQLVSALGLRVENNLNINNIYRSKIVKSILNALVYLNNKLNSKAIAQYLIPVILYFILLRQNINGQIDLYHEGEKLQLNGLPYQDFYLQHGLILNYLLPKVATIILDDTLESVRKIFTFLEPLSYIFLYLLGLNVFRAGMLMALIPTFLCSGIAYWIGLREGLAVLSILFLIKENRPQLTGAISAITFWFSLEYGVYSLFTCLIYYSICHTIKEKIGPQLKGFIFAYFSVTIPILFIFLLLGILDDFFLNVYYQIKFQSLVWGKAFWNFDWSIWSESFRVYCSIIVLIISISILSYQAGKGKLGDYKKLLAISLLSCCFFRTTLGRSDYGHWIDGSTLIYLILFYLVEFLFLSSKHLLTKIFCFISFCITLSFLNAIHKPYTDIALNLTNYWPAKNETAKISRIGKIIIPKQQTDTLLKVKDVINAYSKDGDYIYDFANQGAYYYILNRKSPTKYFNVVYAASSSQQLEVIHDLTTKKPSLVIFKTGSVYDSIDGIPSSKRSQIVYDYLIKNYKTLSNINGTEIYIQKEK